MAIIIEKAGLGFIPTKHDPWRVVWDRFVAVGHAQLRARIGDLHNEAETEVWIEP